jgi:hypothetical protein
VVGADGSHCSVWVIIPSQQTSGSLIFTWSFAVINQDHSPQVMVDFGVNDVKFLGPTIHVNNNVPPLPAGIFHSEFGIVV